MPEVNDMYRAGELAFINNVGTLLEPVDAAVIRDGSARVPVGLSSHSDQISRWQTAISYSRSASDGWIGRIADNLDPDPSNGISINISLDGSNLLQSGRLAVPYSINRDGDGAPGIFAYGDQTDYGAFRRSMIDSVFAVEHEHLLKREYSQRMRRAIDNQQVFISALQAAPELQTTFGENRFFACYASDRENNQRENSYAGRTTNVLYVG